MKEFHSWRQKNFNLVSEYSWRIKSQQHESKIRNELAQHAVSIRLEDATTGIPEPLHSNYPFEWDSEHLGRITAFEKNNQVVLPTGEVRSAYTEGGFLAIYRQLTSGLIYASDGAVTSFKMSQSREDALVNLINEVQGPVLVAVFYRSEVQDLLTRLGISARAFTGATTPKERLQIIDDWNADKIPVLIAAPSAMGHGINLQKGASRTIVWYTHTFDWAQRAQFNARLVRSGQTKTISIFNLVGNAGIDLAVLQALDAKQVGEKALLEILDIKHRFQEKVVDHA
jgi:hypothetical protein